MQVEKFKLKELIQQDNQIALYRAEDQKSSVMIKCAAMEFPNMQECARILQECEILNKLNFEGVPRVITQFTLKSKPYLVLKEVKGAPVMQVRGDLAKNQKLFLQVTISIAKILKRIHSAGVVYKNLKPDNIWFDEKTNKVTLLGFGIAAEVGDQSNIACQKNVLEGNPMYIAPEQTGRINRAIDQRTDLYSFGACLYTILTGKPLFDEAELLATVHAQLSKTPIPAHELCPDIPRSLSDLIQKLLQKAATDRYQSAAGLIHDLQALHSSLAEGTEGLSVLGAFDHSSKFQLPEKLFSRKKALSQIYYSFEKVQEGYNQVLLIHGDTGVGKTTLVQELSRPVTLQQGLILYGKFDLLKAHSPFSALVEGLRNLLQEILLLDELALSQWKKTIGVVMGEDIYALFEILPELELLGMNLDEASSSPQLQGQGQPKFQNRSERFLKLILKFICLFGSKGHPLVVVLDDLQWADPDSLSLLQHLFAVDTQGYILWVGTCRSTAMQNGAPLANLLLAARKNRVRVQKIPLQNLNLNGVISYLMETLFLHKKTLEPLAELLLQKTDGNPFYVGQFLKELHRLGLLHFDTAKGCWSFELEKIQNLDHSSNKMQLLVNSLQRQTSETQTTICLASAIGRQFDIYTLWKASEQNLDLLWQNLLPALKEGLIVPVTGNYHSLQQFSGSRQELQGVQFRFIHDNLYQASYSLIPEDELARYHSRIALLLLGNMDEQDSDVMLFGILEHFNIGEVTVTDPMAREQGALLNYKAAVKSVKACAYDRAIFYVNAARQFASADFWGAAQLFEMNLIEIDYLISQRQLSVAEGKIKAFIHQETIQERWVQLVVRQIAVLGQCKRYEESLEAGIQALQHFGLNFSLTPNRLVLAYQIKKLQREFRKGALDKLLQAPMLENGSYNDMMIIMAELMPIGYVFGYSSFIMQCMVFMAEVSIKYGLHGGTPYVLAAYGGAVIHSLNDPKLGFELGKIAMQLQGRIGPNPQLAGLQFLYGYFFQNWLGSLQSGERYFNASMAIAQENGDNLFSGISALQFCIQRYNEGVPITDLLKTLEVQHKIISHSFLPHATELVNYMKSCIEQYMTPDLMTKVQFGEQVQMDHLSRKVHGWILKARLLYSFGLYQDAAPLWEKALKHASVIFGHPHLLDLYLYSALNAVSLYPTVTIKDKLKLKRLMQRSLRFLKKWKQISKEVCGAKYAMLNASVIALQNGPQQALKLYEEGIELALESENFFDIAVSYELACNFSLEQGFVTIGRSYFRRAKYFYQCYGAVGKIQQLETKYPQAYSKQLSTPLSDESISFNNTIRDQTELDLSTVLKASQTFFGSNRLDDLYRSIISLFIESTGAQKGSFILVKDGRLIVDATEDENGQQEVLQGLPLEDSNRLSISMVQYVYRSRNILLVEDARTDHRFYTEEYIKSNNIKSVLCVPVLFQEKVKGVLYLENNLASHIFTLERMKVIQLLVGQVALALESSLLYNSLEHKIQHRTQDLNHALDQVQEQNDQIITSINYAKDIQERLLPTADAMLEAFPNHFVIWQPQGIVGGDIYLLHSTDKGDWLGVFDCTGHGIPGALLTMIVGSAFHEVFASNEAITAGKVLDLMNASISRQLKPENSFEGADASLIFLSNDKETLQFAGARQCLVCHTPEGEKLIKGDKVSMGYNKFDPDFHYQTHSLPVQGETAIFLGTDGYRDQIGGEGRFPLGYSKLLFLLSQYQNFSREEFKDLLLHSLKEYQGLEDQTDDITVLGLYLNF